MDGQVKPQASRKVVRIGGASGFWGDSSLGPVQLVRDGGIDYLVFDYLAELTMSILAGARMKRPEEGYATDFVTVALRSVLKQAVAQGIRIVSNAGGVNPRGCAAAVQALADELGVPVRVAIVTGDDVLALAPAMRAAGAVDLSSGDPLPEKLVTANAYLGALPIARALDAGADIVITGRCVDSAVTLGVLLHEFGWAADDFDRLAAGSLAGHIIECGCQATGGLHTDWAAVPDWANIGYPIVECHEDGSFIVTKPPETGGLVTPATVGEQLLYEIGDPASYLLPDVTCDFRQVRMEQDGLHRVLVTGARGRPPTGTYKVSATAAVGFKMSAQLTIVGIDAAAKAKRTGEALLERGRRLLRESGAADFLATHLELLGTESAYGPHARPLPTREVVLRLTVTHADRRALEMFSREFAAPGTSWSPGTTGGGGRPSVAPVLRQFAWLIPKEQVTPRGHARRRDVCRDAAPATTAGRAATAYACSGRGARRPTEDRAARENRVRAQRRQGRHIQHRPDRAASGAAAGAQGAGDARTGEGVPPPSGAGAGPPLRAARHPRDQPPLRTRPRRRRHGLVAQRSARQGHGADAARHAGRGARKPAAGAPRVNFDLSDDQLAIRDAVEAICSDFGADYWLERDRDGRWPSEFCDAVARGGWFGVTMPEEHGGAGLGISAAAMVMRTIGKLGAAAVSSVHLNLFGPQPVVVFGTEEQKRRMLPPLIDGSDRACFGVTEPNVGSDTTRLRTFARRAGDRYIVNGQKVWTSTAQHANKILLVARTTPIEECARPIDGVTLFYTDLDRSQCASARSRRWRARPSTSNELFIDGLEIPVEDRIGEEGQGFKYLLHGLNPERILVAAAALGGAETALARATAYAKERVVFGRPIGKNQVIQHPLAECWMRLQAAELLMWKAAALYDAGKPCGIEATAAKYLAAEASFETALRAVRTHGGFGFAKEYHVERGLRESVLSLLAPVTQELALCYVAEQALGLPKSY